MCDRSDNSFYGGGVVDFVNGGVVGGGRGEIVEGECLCCCCGEDVVVVEVESGKERMRLGGDGRVLTLLTDKRKERGWVVVSYLSLQLKLWDLNQVFFVCLFCFFVCVLCVWVCGYVCVFVLCLLFTKIDSLYADNDYLFFFLSSHKQKGTCVRTWKPHEGPVVDMDMDTTGTIIATAGTDTAVQV